ncbi:MAG: tRNA-dihydrouridine synthase [Phycisphaerae bacterium]|nr:tRNA-dihydrouridine synthase [Phycisphaerae bacterium]
MDRSHRTNPCIGRPLRIGEVELSTNLLLAPVAGYCDLAWRVVCREQGGVGLACTDLLSPQGLLRGTAHSLDLAMTNDFDRPLGMQLYGGDGGILAEGALWAVRHGATVIDINMGCPVDKVTKKDGGSKLMCDLARTVSIAERVTGEVGRATKGRVPVTAKMRLGWSCGDLAAPELAVRLARVGIAAVTVHGRYAAQHFKGEACLDGIKAVVEAMRAEPVPVPVIGNGDVVNGAAAVKMMSRTGCDGVMIGRGSFSRPWVFREAWAAQRGDLIAEPSEAEKIAVIRRYFGLMLEYRDERYALTNIRRRISWLGKALGPCKPMKERVRLAATAAEVWAALDEFESGGLRMFESDREEAEAIA